MEQTLIPGPGTNRLLQLLGEAELSELRPYLEKVTLERGDVCIHANSPIEHVYFLESGLSSCIFPDETKGITELGVQGYEGLIGVPALLGVDKSPHKVFMQVGGSAFRIPTHLLMAAMDKNLPLASLLLRYAQVFLLQTAQAVHANARFNLYERLARWLIMASDRLGPQLALTHEYLAYMLGTRRAGVTDALHILEGKHLIRSTRGLVVILDPDGLRALAGTSYGIAEAEYRRLIGPLL